MTKYFVPLIEIRHCPLGMSPSNCVQVEGLGSSMTGTGKGVELEWESSLENFFPIVIWHNSSLS